MNSSPARPRSATARPISYRHVFAVASLIGAVVILSMYVRLLNQSVAQGVQWREDTRSAATSAAKPVDRRLASGFETTRAATDAALAPTRRQ